MLGQPQSSKTFTKREASCQKEHFEKLGHFFQSKRTDRLDPPVPLFVFVRFCSFFVDRITSFRYSDII